jgi:hypothetical protein
MPGLRADGGWLERLSRDATDSRSSGLFRRNTLSILEFQRFWCATNAHDPLAQSVSNRPIRQTRNSQLSEDFSSPNALICSQKRHKKRNFQFSRGVTKTFTEKPRDFMRLLPSS